MFRRSVLLVAGAALAGCGGGGGAGPGPTPSQIQKTAGDNQVGVAGQAVTSLEVTVLDASSSPVAGVTVTWAAASGGGSVNPSSGSTGADGKATTIRTLGASAGAQTTTATVPGIAPVTFTSVAQIQGATQIAAGANSTRSDSVLSTATFSAVVRDQNSLPVAGVVVAWTSTAGGGVLSQSVDTTDGTGTTSVQVTLTQNAVPHTVQAAVPGLQGSPVGFVDNATAGNATVMALNGGNGQAGPVGSPLPIPHSVIVHDAYGNPKPGVAVSWVLGEGGGSIAPPAGTTTNASGIASVVRTLSATPGVHSDTASAGGLAGSPIAFTDTAGPVVDIQVGGAANVFTPSSSTVAAGTFARFTWGGGVSHTVSWDSPPIPLTDSPLQATGTYIARLSGPGTYNYHCAVHGGPGTGMHGTITAN